jgi:ketosteroid isomerase-like protein
MSREADIQIIMELPHRYSDAANRRNWDDFAATYAVDAHWEVPGVNVDLRGREVIKKWVAETFPNNDFFVQLIAGQRLVHYEPEKAIVHTYFQALSRHLDGSGFHYIMVYDDQIAKNDGIWEFSSRIGHFLYRDKTAPTGVDMPFPALRTTFG